MVHCTKQETKKNIYMHLSLKNKYLYIFQRILEYGINTVRIRVQGIGAGRMVGISQKLFLIFYILFCYSYRQITF